MEVSSRGRVPRCPGPSGADTGLSAPAGCGGRAGRLWSSVRLARTVPRCKAFASAQPECLLWDAPASGCWRRDGRPTRRSPPASFWRLSRGTWSRPKLGRREPGTPALSRNRRTRRNVLREAGGSSPPHFSPSFRLGPRVGSAAVWPGPPAIRASASAPSCRRVPHCRSPLSPSASRPPPLPPPLPPPPRKNSAPRNVSAAAPPPASCLPFSPVCLGVSPGAFPPSSPVSSPRLGSAGLLSVPPLAASAWVSSVLFLYGYHAR